jgi:hypothetical protein
MAAMNIFTGTFKRSNDTVMQYLHHFTSPASLENKILPICHINTTLLILMAVSGLFADQ